MGRWVGGHQSLGPTMQNAEQLGGAGLRPVALVQVWQNSGDASQWHQQTRQLSAENCSSQGFSLAECRGSLHRHAGAYAQAAGEHDDSDGNGHLQHGRLQAQSGRSGVGQATVALQGGAVDASLLLAGQDQAQVLADATQETSQVAECLQAKSTRRKAGRQRAGRRGGRDVRSGDGVQPRPWGRKAGHGSGRPHAGTSRRPHLSHACSRRHHAALDALQQVEQAAPDVAAVLAGVARWLTTRRGWVGGQVLQQQQPRWRRQRDGRERAHVLHERHKRGVAAHHARDHRRDFAVVQLGVGG